MHGNEVEESALGGGGQTYKNSPGHEVTWPSSSPGITPTGDFLWYTKFFWSRNRISFRGNMWFSSSEISVLFDSIPISSLHADKTKINDLMYDEKHNLSRRPWIPLLGV